MGKDVNVHDKIKYEIQWTLKEKYDIIGNI